MCDVPRGELLEVARRAPASESAGGDVELALEAHALGDLREQLVDRGDADRREHLLAVGVGQREVAGRHCSATTAPVGLDVQQRVDLGRVGEPDPDEPALAVRDPR